MDLETFKRTDACRRMNYGRCIYVIRPTSNKEMGIDAKWIKIGQSKTCLQNRLRQYNTALPYGIDVLAVATVRQPMDCDELLVSKVEKSICDDVIMSKQRIRKTESFRRRPWMMQWILSCLLCHPDVQQVWAPGKGFLDKTEEDIVRICGSTVVVDEFSG